MPKWEVYHEKRSEAVIRVSAAKMLPGEIVESATTWGGTVAAIRRLEQVTCVVGDDGVVRIVLPDDQGGREQDV